MKKITSAILCLAALPALAADKPKKFVESPQNTETPKEEHRRLGVRRSTFIYVAPRETWGSIAGWIAGSVTLEIIESHRQAREERLLLQQERVEQGFGNPYAAKVDTTPLFRPVAPPLVERTAGSEIAPKPEPRITRAGEFRPKIIGLD